MCRLLRLRARYRKQNKTSTLPPKKHFCPCCNFPSINTGFGHLGLRSLHADCCDCERVIESRIKPPNCPKRILLSLLQCFIHKKHQKKSLPTPSSGSLSFLPQTHTLPLKQFIQRIRRLRILKRLHKILMRQ